MAEFTMPSLGADMDEGLLQEWLVRPGDTVRKGDPVAVVETSKAAIEVECFASGTVGQLLVEPGTTVPVGTPLALIEPSAEAAGPTPGAEAKPTRGTPPKPKPKPKRKRKPAAGPGPGPAGMPVPAGEAEGEAEAGPVPETGPRAEPAPGPTPPPGTARPAAVSGQAAGPAGPLIRQLAERTGVDLAAVHGTGPGGRITRADIERAAPAPGRRRVSPLARRLAEELQVDLADVTGSGSQGAVHADDVRRAAYDRAAGAAPMGGAAPVHPARPGPAPPAPSAGITPVPPPPPARHAADRTSAMRQAIAALMARSKREIPHYYLSTTIDLAAAMDWLRAYNRGRPAGGQLVPAALLLQAAALAARRVPQLNGFWTDDHFTAGEGVQLGVAVSLRGGGLIAPVLHDADTLGAPELMAGLKDLVARARTGRLRGSELTGATITVTNLGDQGVESVLGVIHPPQVALVGFGRVVEQPRAVSGLIGVRPVVTATLSADHRASDGAMGARYLTAVDRLLQKPEELRAPEKLAQPEELEKPEES